MAHASFRAIGPVEGRAAGLVRALLVVLVVLGDRGSRQPFGQQAVLRCPGYHAQEMTMCRGIPHAPLPLGCCAFAVTPRKTAQATKEVCQKRLKNYEEAKYQKQKNKQ
jgi:hypothetical protein